MGPFLPDGTSEYYRFANLGKESIMMEGVLMTATAGEWRKRLDDVGGPVGLVLNVDDTRRLEQILARGMIKNVGGYDVPGTPIKFSTYNSMGTEIPSPALDNCGAALRAEFAPEKKAK